MMRSVILKNDSDMVLTYAESFIEQTRLDLQVIEKSFFKIGFRLNEAVDNNYVQALGYEDIYELAQDQFGFKKTTTKNLMEVNRTYSTGYYGRPSMEIDERYKGFSQTQLVEMLPLGPWSREKIPQTFTARDIRDYKKITAVGFDAKTVGARDLTDIRDNPDKYVAVYRDKKASGQIVEEKKKPAEITSYSAEDHTRLMKDLDKLIKPKQNDVVPGQITIDDVLPREESISRRKDLDDALLEGEEIFVQGNGKAIETYSQSTDQDIYYHYFQSDEQRKNFIENAENYPITVLCNEELGLKVSRCDFKNGAKLYRSDYYVFSEFHKKEMPACKYHLVVPDGDELPGTSVVCSDVSGKVWTMDGVAITYIVKYLAKHRREL